MDIKAYKKPIQEPVLKQYYDLGYADACILFRWFLFEV